MHNPDGPCTHNQDHITRLDAASTGAIVTAGERLVERCYFERYSFWDRHYISLVNSGSRDTSVLGERSVHGNSQGFIMRAQVSITLYALITSATAKIGCNRDTHTWLIASNEATGLSYLAS